MRGSKLVHRVDHTLWVSVEVEGGGAQVEGDCSRAEGCTMAR